MGNLYKLAILRQSVDRMRALWKPTAGSRVDSGQLGQAARYMLRPVVPQKMSARGVRLRR